MNKKIAMMLFCTATLSSAASFAADEKSTAYTGAKEAASTEFKLAKSKCDAITGNPKDVCLAEAKAARVHAEANAKAEYKNTVAARTSARKDIADADYDVEKAKCGSMSGNDKDVCIKQAKSNKVAAVSNAKADKKVIDARVDANDDKVNAEYKVAIEKCDALSGQGKDNCVAAAKSKFGK
ncbi:hypothetical protein UNDYM_0762 [Undibacterium sp. YM2]|uniref:hypothetical protein n=1 Tax=unclassified Undibacterium TaxID=2630295 RepID=UPI001331F28D|nr:MULTISPECIES: hypothetical protein [unclassified Undibacterium]BBB59051.1 hypothetical protein UNDKW_0778 [Undibacterium sp. KW1]BBB65015.1 hypothetical protein UNDYM_0762 [Undibacterium sp. YM2]